MASATANAAAGAPARSRRRPPLTIEPLEPRLTMAADMADAIASARVFGGGTNFGGEIGDGVHGRRDVDLVGFAVPAGGRLTVDLDARSLQGGSSLDSYLRVFDASGRVVASNDDYGGSTDSFISATMRAAGTYYVGVSGYGNSAYTPLLAASGRNGSTGRYSLTVAVAAPEPVDRAGDTRATAGNLGVLDGGLTASDSIGGADFADFYRFTIGRTSQVGIRLDWMSSDADLQLLDERGEQVVSSMSTGTTGETIDRDLPSGTYYAVVTPYDGVTNYTLTLSARPVTAAFPAPSYRNTTGWGFVDAAAAVAKVRGHGGPFSPVVDLGGNEIGNDLVNAPEVWAQGYTGAGVVVAVVDSGVDYDHPDLRQNIWVNPREIAGDGIDNDGNGFVDDVRGWDFADNDSTPMDVVDERLINWMPGNPGHGTHVAGTIAAARNGIGSTGVAPDARIMAVRVFDQRGKTTAARIARGVRYAADNGAHVINMSLGGGLPSGEVESAVRHAVSRGCVVVIAAGNSGASSPENPGRLAATIDGVITVGAATDGHQLLFFSNRSGSDRRMQYVVAPGTVHSTLPGNAYGFLSGTSMAAPHVAGVAALMRSALPTADQMRYWAHVTATARPLAHQTPSRTNVTAQVVPATVPRQCMGQVGGMARQPGDATAARIHTAQPVAGGPMSGNWAAYASFAADPVITTVPRKAARPAYPARA